MSKQIQSYLTTGEINGLFNISLSIPIKTNIPILMEEYGNDDLSVTWLEPDYEYGIDDILAKCPTLKNDIELFKRLGYSVDLEEIEENMPVKISLKKGKLGDNCCKNCKNFKCKNIEDLTGTCLITKSTMELNTLCHTNQFKNKDNNND